MLLLTFVLVALAAVTLLLGVAGAGEDALRYVYASIVSCLLAAVFLVLAVLRRRPSRRPVLPPGPGTATWAGATPGPPEPPGGRQPAGAPHVQVPPAGPVPAGRDNAAGVPAVEGVGAPVDAATAGRADLGEDPEGARFAAALRGVVDPVRLERLRGRFLTLDALRAAGVDEITQVPGMSRELAERVHARLARLPLS